MGRAITINIPDDYCDKCLFCTWRTEGRFNTGWHCSHYKSEHRLILDKADYDASGPQYKHIYTPEWCPLPEKEDE